MWSWHPGWGAGVSVEQAITEDVGLSLRAMKSDGKTEVDSFTSTDSSAALAAVARGVRWARPKDSVGLGLARNWISSSHVNYLSLGGADAVIVPVHTDGWAHFRQNAKDLRVSFDALGFGKRLKLLEPGVATMID